MVGLALLLMEGGFKPHGFWRQNAALMKSLPEMLELAMMLETQALDLYLRFTARLPIPRPGRCSITCCRKKAHLARLAGLWEEKQGGAGARS